MAQKLVDDAVVRYHKILESPSHQDLAWAQALEDSMRKLGMASGTRVASPFLRPHFIAKKHYDQMAKAAASLFAAIERVEKLALSSPVLLQRLELLPAERMLALIEPGYLYPHVASAFQFLEAGGTLLARNFQPVSTAGLAYGEHLGELFYDAAPVKEFRKKHKLSKLGGMKTLVASVAKAWKSFGGKKQPNVAVLEFRQPFQSLEATESTVLVELFRQHGFKTELASPEQLDYRQGSLAKGDYKIDLIFRASSLHEFLLRFDLNHPLVRAYREAKVCVVNSFRAELAQKRALFSLLTDEAVTAKFPAAEKKAIEAFVPWTRTLAPGKLPFGKKTIDLIEYVSAHKDRFVLLPNDSSSNLPSFDGATLEQAAWDRSIKQALRERYVVQDRANPVISKFPVMFYGALEYRDVQVDERCHLFLGEAKTATTYLSSGQGGFSTMEGFAPTYLIEGR
jgi:hypothetical protein